jgi:hypothetical protein
MIRLYPWLHRLYRLSDSSIAIASEEVVIVESALIHGLAHDRRLRTVDILFKPTVVKVHIIVHIRK